ncbi:RidA family protein [Sulfitobacter sp. G21635-S1]|jgi:enamine deaminase RidA (YjgF/YER057c/UK114 family)|uniref:RidA family protein n=1 Tax=Sulfitobacter sp. G21635-S1 TaxID=3014043 RepID=UPI0022AF911C|nr:RidA family protein [Sulfitobacter sp. G21635-S1]MCZ4254871.1 RidA family protein [Sulfitobacter sp. G21635-S1]
MSQITRHHTNARMSQIVTHNGTVYLAGQVGTPGASVAQQTQDCLDNIDKLLAEAGSDKSRILQAVIWLADMADFEEMNGVWDAWVPTGQAPARACGEAKLARADFTVEIIVTAAA